MWQNSQCHAAYFLTFTREFLTLKLLFFVQRKDGQLLYRYFKCRSVKCPIYPYLKIYICYGFDVFTRTASVYKMKIRKILNGPIA